LLNDHSKININCNAHIVNTLYTYLSCCVQTVHFR